jgi:hypothetical protein
MSDEKSVKKETECSNKCVGKQSVVFSLFSKPKSYF